MNLKNFLLKSVIMAVIIAATYTVYVERSNKIYISKQSLETLTQLNKTFGMSVTDDLSNTTSHTSHIMADILKVNALQKNFQKLENRGILVSFHNNHTLLIQPATELSNEKLIEAAKAYTSSIPEFVAAEVDQNILVTQTGTPTDIDHIEVTPERKKETRKNIRVAVIDSGIAANHRHFQDTDIKVNPKANTIKDNKDVQDDVSHGTHIAGIIASRSENITILPYKVADQQGGRLSNIIKALNLAIADDADVINMSLGIRGESYALKNLIEKAHKKRIIIIAAAGNFNSSDKFYPAGYDETIAVAATYFNGEKTEKSNFGAWVDISAPGYRIYSAVPSGYAYKSGTSQSAAFITAAISNQLSQSQSESTESLLATLIELPLISKPLVE